jgi:acetyl-CoA carboxylase biotin carboxyl carrier protein
MQTKKKPAPKARAKPKNLKKSSAVLTKKKASTAIKVPPEFTMKQVKEIVALIKDAGIFTSFAYKTDEFEIEISVGAPSASANTALVVAQVSSATSVIATAPTVVSTPAPFTISASERLITSPMIGTFYRRPSPSSPPFVEVGDRVKPDTDVCIVEVMKLLNTIPAECSGTVSKILVEDGENIEVGQALMVIEVS